MGCCGNKKGIQTVQNPADKYRQTGDQISDQETAKQKNPIEIVNPSNDKQQQEPIVVNANPSLEETVPQKNDLIQVEPTFNEDTFINDIMSQFDDLNQLFNQMAQEFDEISQYLLSVSGNQAVPQ